MAYIPSSIQSSIESTAFFSSASRLIFGCGMSIEYRVSYLAVSSIKYRVSCSALLSIEESGIEVSGIEYSLGAALFAFVDALSISFSSASRKDKPMHTPILSLVRGPKHYILA